MLKNITFTRLDISTLVTIQVVEMALI